MAQNPLRVIILKGKTPYKEAHTLQKDTVSSRVASKTPDTLLLVQHPPVITIGHSGTEKDITASSPFLEKQGISVHIVERGGRVTYHGPGQIVGYPIVNLKALKIGVKTFVNRLESTMIRAAAQMGVTATTQKGAPGIYCPQGKIGAIGVRVTRGVTFHGFSFNLNPNLDHYNYISPCGGKPSDITSVQAVTGNAPSFEEASSILINAFSDVFNMTIIEGEGEPS